NFGPLIGLLKAENFDPVAAAELERPGDKANVLWRRILSLGGLLAQQPQLLLKGLGRDAVSGASIDQGDQRHAFPRESLLDLPMRRKVGVLIAHQANNWRHAAIGRVVDRVNLVQQELLPRCERRELDEMASRRAGKNDRI